MFRIRYEKVFRNARIKLFAFLGALILWLYVVTDNVFTHVQKVPLRFTNVPRGSILARPVPDFVKIEFRGTGRELLLWGSREKWFEIDLEHAGREAVIPLSVEMVKGIPRGSAVVPIRVADPESVSIAFDEFAVKKIPVESNLIFLPLDGYIQVGEARFEPDSIAISGPKSIVSPVTAVPTVSREFRNLLKPIEGKTDLVLPSGENLRWTVSSVRFSVDIQRLGERVLSEIPIEVVHVPSGTRIRVVPPHLSLKLQGGVNVISRLEKEDIRATIDYDQHLRRRRDKNIPATIHVPPDVGFLDVHPPFFEILIEKP